jgi:UDPglucose 6-dehydrogenase
MDLAVVGTGYVGLVTGAVLSYIGHNVTCIDIDKAKIDRLLGGKSPIYEPGLEDLMAVCLENKRLNFTSDYECVKIADVVFITVGTPSLPTGGVDLSHLKGAATEIGRNLDNDRLQIVINKSTVPVGSGNWVEMLVSQGIQNGSKAVAASVSGEHEISNGTTRAMIQAKHKFVVVSNPEFLREGSAVYDSFFPDRIVIGTCDKQAQEMMRELYSPLLEQSFVPPSFLMPSDQRANSVPLVITDLASAEMIKYAANAFLATKISFANEIAGICESVGADVTEVMRGVGLDHRIGKGFLNAGVGWGGSCFAKDLSALVATAEEYLLSPSILSAARQVNLQQRRVAIKKLQMALKIIKGRTVGLLGLAFKPNTDDVRDAPSLDIAEQIINLGAMVKAYDPVAEESCRRARPDLDINYCPSIDEVAFGSDALIVVTEWEEFRSIKLSSLKELMRTPVIIDGRNIFDPETVRQAGFEYHGIGKG